MRKATIIKTLKSLGVNDEYEINSPHEIEVMIHDENTLDKIMKALKWSSAYKCGYGAWVIQSTGGNMGEWGDKSSRWHY